MQSRVKGCGGVSLAVRATGTAGLGAGTQRLVDDLLDGTRTTATFRAAAQAPVDLLGIPGKVVRAADRTADIVVGQNIARTNNHKRRALRGAAVTLLSLSNIEVHGGMQKEKARFQAIPNYAPNT